MRHSAGATATVAAQRALLPPAVSRVRRYCCCRCSPRCCCPRLSLHLRATCACNFRAARHTPPPTCSRSKDSGRAAAAAAARFEEPLLLLVHAAHVSIPDMRHGIRRADVAAAVSQVCIPGIRHAAAAASRVCAPGSDMPQLLLLESLLLGSDVLLLIRMLLESAQLGSEMLLPLLMQLLLGSTQLDQTRCCSC